MSQPCSAVDAADSAGFFAAIRIIALREIAAYFDSSIAYVYTIGFVILANGIFMNEFFLTGIVDMTYFFDLMPLLLVFFLPAITMRLWAEERKIGTIELLLTLPVRASEAVLGKFVAALALFGVFLLGTLPIPVMLFALGEPDAGLIVGGYAGLLLLGALFLSFGLLLSAVSSDQIVAFVASAMAGFAFVLSGMDRVVAVLDGLYPAAGIGTLLYEHFSALPHFESLVRGVIELRSVVYFSLMTGLFLWLNAKLLERDHR